MAEKGNFIAFFYLEIHIAEKHFAIDRGRQTFYFKDLVAGFTRRCENDSRITTRRSLYLLDIEFFKHFFARRGLLALCYVGTESLYEFKQFTTFFFGFLVLLLLLTQCKLARLIPETVVAGKKLKAIIINIEGMRAHRVEEVAVVGHDKNRILEIGQILFEPRHCVEVEVVGRFVEQKVVGISEKSFGEKYTHLFIGAYVAHKHIVAVFPDAESAQKRGSIAFGIPAFQFGEFFFQFGSPYAVGIAEISLGVEGVFFLHYIPKDRMPAQNGFENRTVIEFEVVLLKHAHALARTLFDRALSRRQLTAEHTHQRRLACTVSTDDSIAVTGRKLQVHVLEKRFFTELNT